MPTRSSFVYKLLFVGHYFHQKTTSSRFFIDVLKTRFEVTEVFVDPSRDGQIDNLENEYEYIVLWQVDYLAPQFLNLGKKVIVVPMYDASGGLCSLHWKISKNARFLCFSRKLHLLISAAGCKSLLVKYFIKPAETFRNNFDKLKIFFWQRRPQSGLDWRLCERLFGHQIHHLHVHLPADPPYGNYPATKITPNYDYKLTTSNWFNTKTELLNSIADCNVYIAPRAAEGIGMSFLEAFALGRVVIAHDDATQNEYIANWVNGILINKDNSGRIDYNPQLFARLGRTAHLAAHNGEKEWTQKFVPKILDFIEGTSRSPEFPGTRGPDFAKLASNKYLQGQSKYEEFLSQYSLVFANEACREPSNYSLLPELKISRLYCLENYPELRSFLYSGWDTKRKSPSCKDVASIAFSFEVECNQVYDFNLKCSATTETVVEVTVNSTGVACLILNQNINEYSIVIPAKTFNNVAPNSIQFSIIPKQRDCQFTMHSFSIDI